MDVASREQLELQIAAIARDAPAPRIASASMPLAALELEPFSRWLVAQRDRGDWIDALAEAARRDASFPKIADPEQVGAYLANKGVGDADVFEQLDDAERCWRSL